MNVCFISKEHTINKIYLNDLFNKMKKQETETGWDIGDTRGKKEDGFMKVFMAISEVAQMCCGPAPENSADSFKQISTHPINRPISPRTSPSLMPSCRHQLLSSIRLCIQ